MPETFEPKVYDAHVLQDPLYLRYSKTSEQFTPPDPAVNKVAEANSSWQIDVLLGSLFKVGFTKLEETIQDSLAVSEAKQPEIAEQLPIQALISTSVLPLARMF